VPDGSRAPFEVDAKRTLVIIVLHAQPPLQRRGPDARTNALKLDCCIARPDWATDLIASAVLVHINGSVARNWGGDGSPEAPAVEKWRRFRRLGAAHPWHSYR
jgi:hypothetical protein